MSQSYIKYKGGHGVPLCSLLMSVAFSMYAMYADILAGSEGVVVFVGKRPDRIVNPMVVCLFMGSPVKWVFLDDSDSCKNDGCPKMPEGVFGGTGRTLADRASSSRWSATSRSAGTSGRGSARGCSSSGYQ